MKHIWLAVAATVLVIGCGNSVQNNDAVKEGVQEYLAGRAGLDVSSMEVKVTSVEFKDDKAYADVSIHAKGSSNPAAAMQMKYTLERKGSRWVVKGKAGGSTHGGGPATPPGGGANPRGGMSSPQGGGAMPPGHPPMGTKKPNSATE